MSAIRAADVHSHVIVRFRPYRDWIDQSTMLVELCVQPVVYVDFDLGRKFLGLLISNTVHFKNILSERAIRKEAG